MQGIFMTPDNHLAIREGRKTVTRRIRNPQPEHGDLEYERWQCCDETSLYYIKPRYQVGEVVYIKEAWQSLGNKENTVYKLDGNSKLVWNINGKQGEEIVKKWRSPLFLPEKFARDFIQITDVRAERLQEIEKEPDGFVKEGYTPLMLTDTHGQLAEFSLDFAWYENVWDLINGEGDYALNKWVWRYEFKKVESPVGR